MRHCEQLIWRQISLDFEWQCPNIAGYILDHVEDDKVKGFNLKSANGVVTIQTIGGHHGKKQETFCDMELSGDELLKRRKYSL